uniref:Ovule protein n=1 Tax=Ascaris lumbricoides TaxID=6252 RepID=A0A0M3IB75_ASCLU
EKIYERISSLITLLRSTFLSPISPSHSSTRYCDLHIHFPSKIRTAFSTLATFISLPLLLT